MRRFAYLVRSLGRDQHGAALIEYTILIGILVAAVIGLIIAVGAWTSGTWAAFNTLI